MEALIGLIIAVVGGFLYTKFNVSQAQVDATMATTKAKDDQLQASQSSVEQAISDIDTGINKIKQAQPAKDSAVQNETADQAAANLNKELK